MDRGNNSIYGVIGCSLRIVVLFEVFLSVAAHMVALNLKEMQILI